MKFITKIKNDSLKGVKEKKYEKLRLTIISLILLSVFIKMSTHDVGGSTVSVLTTSLILLLSSLPLFLGLYYRQFKQVLQYCVFITLSIVTAVSFIHFLL